MNQFTLFDHPPSPEAVAAHFDRRRGERERDEGVRLAEMDNANFVTTMRAYARDRVAMHGEVHIDDLRRFALTIGAAPASSAAWGAIFREKGWKKTGEYRASAFVANHAHVSPVWRWAG